jgi:hypothetical protein
VELYRQGKFPDLSTRVPWQSYQQKSFWRENDNFYRMSYVLKASLISQTNYNYGVLFSINYINEPVELVRSCSEDARVKISTYGVGGSIQG